MSTPNIKAQEAGKWWQKEPYLKSYKCEEFETGQEVWDFRYDIPAIILEAQRLERVRIATCLHSIARKEDRITGDDAILVVPYAMVLFYINPPEKP